MKKNVDSSLEEVAPEGLLSLEKKINRVERKPLHHRSKTGAPTREGYVRRKVLADPTRIQEFLEAGYTFVRNDGIQADPLHSDQSQVGGSVVRYVMNRRSTADIKHGYLMEIPKDIYEADQKAKRDARPTLTDTVNAEFRRQGVDGGIVK